MLIIKSKIRNQVLIIFVISQKNKLVSKNIGRNPYCTYASNLIMLKVNSTPDQLSLVYA
jgi:hypothetical protein